MKTFRVIKIGDLYYTQEKFFLFWITLKWVTGCGGINAHYKTLEEAEQAINEYWDSKHYKVIKEITIC